MVRAEDIDREVNRLYWQTTEPVTRLAEQIGVSRGTFYNRLRPLPAGANCSTCGGRLLFRTRSARDTGEAHCGECEGTERVGAAGATGAGSAQKTAAARKPTKSSSAQQEPPGRPSPAKSGPDAAAAPVRVPKILEDDEQRTQLLFIAVGAAVLGLGILYYTRHRS